VKVQMMHVLNTTLIIPLRIIMIQSSYGHHGIGLRKEESRFSICGNTSAQ
jgi:hypothetical protein